MLIKIINFIYDRLWGDLITIPLPNGDTLGLSFLVIVLLAMGIYCTIRTKLLPIRLFPEMIRAVSEKEKKEKHTLSGLQDEVMKFKI